MKRLLVLFILLLTIFLSGCGIYNLNSFVLPDDTEFLALIQELYTPEEICQYMLDNFESEEHPFISLTPYQLFVTQKGDCNDFSTFAIFVANYHNYETYQIHIFFKGTSTEHMLGIYLENGKYNFSDNQYYIFTNSPDFKTIINYYDTFMTDLTWSKYIVYDYDMNIIEQFPF